MRILGIDCSSSTVGFGILEIDTKQNIKFIDACYFKPPKGENIFARLKETQQEVIRVINKYNIDCVAIEEFAKFFSKASSANTIITLVIFNRAIGLAVYDHLNISPTMINIMTIRHLLKYDKMLPAKEEMPSIIERHLDFIFPYKLNKNNNIRNENFDMADALAVALVYAYQITGKINEIKKNRKKNSR